MRFSCFRAVSANAVEPDQDEIPRSPRKKSGLRRQGTVESASSRYSTASTNSSISKLPPCNRASDYKVEALMMPSPPEDRPSRCLRMSHPKTYGNIVDSMKKSKGCREWRAFPVFYNDEIDMSISAVDVARKRAADYEQKLRSINSFGSDERESVGMDMIG